MFKVKSWNSENVIDSTLHEIFTNSDFSTHNNIFTEKRIKCSKKRKFINKSENVKKDYKLDKKKFTRVCEDVHLFKKIEDTKVDKNVEFNKMNIISHKTLVKSKKKITNRTDICNKKINKKFKKDYFLNNMHYNNDFKSDHQIQEQINNENKFINDPVQSTKLKNKYVNNKNLSQSFSKSLKASGNTIKEQKYLALYKSNLSNLKSVVQSKKSTKNSNRKTNYINMNIDQLKSIDDLNKPSKIIEYKSNEDTKRQNMDTLNNMNIIDNSDIKSNGATKNISENKVNLDNKNKKPRDLIIYKESNMSTKPCLTLNPSGTKLRDKMLARLAAGRFRYLNEQIADRNSYEFLDLLANDNDCFRSYHEGFNQQVSKWTTNPVDLIIKYINNRPKHLVIADMGCGDAKIAAGVKNKVHSFDVEALNNRVIVSDMANVPLKSDSIDICVYCLSLMGKNLDEILCEGNRVLKLKGTLLIVEVKSRFTNYGEFVRKLKNIGFKPQNIDESNKMFIWLQFIKFKTVNLKRFSDLSDELKPSVYRKR